MKPSTLFVILDDCGIHLTAFSDLTTISRNTLHRWKLNNFSTVRDTLRLTIALDMAEKLRVAKSIGVLPFLDNGRRSERLKTIRRALAEAEKVSTLVRSA